MSHSTLSPLKDNNQPSAELIHQDISDSYLNRDQTSHNEILMPHNSNSPQKDLIQIQQDNQGRSTLSGMGVIEPLNSSRKLKQDLIKDPLEYRKLLASEDYSQRIPIEADAINDEDQEFNPNLYYQSPGKQSDNANHAQFRYGTDIQANHYQTNFSVHPLVENKSKNYVQKLRDKQQQIFNDRLGAVTQQKAKKNSCFGFLSKNVKPAQDQDLNLISSKISKQLDRQQKAEENWAKVRKMRHKIIGMGILKSLYTNNREFRESTEAIETKFVILPDSKLKLTFDIFVNLAYFASFLLTPYVIAFDILPLNRQGLRWLEFTLDWIILVNIIAQFFTAQQADSDVVDKLKDIARKYIFSFFIFDILSCLPGIISAERAHWPYYFKVLRYIQVWRLFEQMTLLTSKLKIYFLKSQEAFDNFFTLFKTLFYLTILFHVFACIWILIGDTDGGWIDNITYGKEEPELKLKLDDQGSELYLYVTSVYFVVATATTVGYGDVFAWNSREKAFMIFLEFTGICIFSIITGQITGLKKIKKISQIIDQKSEEIESYLCEIDQSIPQKDMDSATYDKAIDYIKNSYLKGVSQSLREGDYFKLLTPKLKNSLIQEVLKDYHKQFYFFFHDIQNKNHADEAFIRKVLSNLDCQIFLPFVDIIDAGEIVTKLYFVQQGSVIVSSSFQDALRSLPQELQMEVRQSIINQTQQSVDPNHIKRGSTSSNYISPVTYITILPLGSFFGDYQILFNLPSNYSFQSFSSYQTLCMTISAHKFLQICEQFPKFHSFLCQRALMRRNHFKMEEFKAKQNNLASRSRGRRLETEAEIIKVKSKKRAIEISNARDRNKLLDPSLLDLSFIETPKFKSDLEQVSVKFRIPIIRMYLQGMQSIASNNQKFMNSSFHKFDDFFNLTQYVLEGEDLKTVKNELEFHCSNKYGKEKLDKKKQQSKDKSHKQRNSKMFDGLNQIGRDSFIRQPQTAQVSTRLNKNRRQEKGSITSLPPIDPNLLSTNSKKFEINQNFAPDQL
eukprot:403353701